MIRQAIIIACWVTVAVIAVFLRFDGLEARPFHADEATGARITAKRMEDGGAHFDPKHYHGPLLADLAMPLCRARGEDGWREMTKFTLRLVPAVSGTLLVLLPLLGRRRFGDAPMLLASALLATSPLLVYYSRMFIHEQVLALLGIAFLFSLVSCARFGLPGFLLGLMFATKETFAISVIAWTGAAALLAIENRRFIGHAVLREWLRPVGISLLAFILTAVFLYTDGFSHRQGIIDAVRTYFVYETGEGHDKPFNWYFQFLVVPQKSGGMWWFGTPLVLLAMWAFATTFRKPDPSGTVMRFLAYSAAGHFLIYSLIAYKTPWLACLPLAHVCLLAGFAIKDFTTRSITAKAVLTIVTAVCLVTQFRQSRAATGRLASDERNPFAYVPTRRDTEKLETWLGELRAAMPAGTLDSVAVVGSGYWPLPWYLRSFEKTGYWNEPPADLSTFPMVFAMPDEADAVKRALSATHIELPRGLRANVPVYLHVSNEVWERWLNTDDR